MVRSTRLVHGFTALTMALTALGALTPGAHAQSFPPPVQPPNIQIPGSTYVVTTAQDTNDASCDVRCSLRDAIVAANGHIRFNGMAADQIIFRIPVDEPLDLTLRSPLPAISSPSLIVDGANQPTTVTDTLRGVPVTLHIPHPGNVALHGSATAPTGLSISGGVNLSNLELTGFSGTAITLSGGSGKALQSLNVHDNGTGVAIGGSNAALASSSLSGNGVGLVLGGSGNFVQGSTITNSSAQGVSITGTNNTLGGQARNLISGNAGDGVVVLASSGGGHRIIGNFIGVDATGTVAQPNGGNGINLNVNTEPMTIGGTSAGERNVISGNTGAGVVVNLAAAPGTPATVTIRGNFIGTNAAGTAAIGNGGSGVDLEGSTQSGLDDFSLRVQVIGNVIAGNLQNGVFALGGAHHVIQSNMIGTDPSGTVSVGNGRNGRFHGVAIQDGRSITIGGDTPALGNVIAHNANSGVIVFTTTGAQSVTSVGNTIRQNRIFDNGALGIDLATVDEVGNGTVTANDPGDTDSGPNRRQNFPVLLNALRQPDGTVVVVATLDSPLLAAYAIDFYSAASCDRPGNGEGDAVVGSMQTVLTTAGAPFVFHSSAPVGASATVITATATRVNTGDTSEFSACVPIV